MCSASASAGCIKEFGNVLGNCLQHAGLCLWLCPTVTWACFGKTQRTLMPLHIPARVDTLVCCVL